MPINLFNASDQLVKWDNKKKKTEDTVPFLTSGRSDRSGWWKRNQTARRQLKVELNGLFLNISII